MWLVDVTRGLLSAGPRWAVEMREGWGQHVTSAVFSVPRASGAVSVEVRTQYRRWEASARALSVRTRRPQSTQTGESRQACCGHAGQSDLGRRRRTRNHGSWSWKRPIWSWSLFLRHGQIVPPRYSGALCKLCFRMTQAGSLPAGPWGEVAAFSEEEIFSSRLVGILSWLAPAPSLLAGLPQTTLNESPLPLGFPQWNLCHASAQQQRSQGGGPASSPPAFLSSGFLQLLPYPHPLRWTSHFFCAGHISYVWKLCWSVTGIARSVYSTVRMALSLEVIWKLLWIFARLGWSWFPCHCPVGTKNGTCNMAPAEAGNDDISHHMCWLAQPCKHCGPGAFLLGVYSQ